MIDPETSSVNVPGWLAQPWLWPKLLRVPALAAAPHRVVLGTFAIVVLGVWWSALTGLARWIGPEAWSGVVITTWWHPLIRDGTDPVSVLSTTVESWPAALGTPVFLVAFLMLMLPVLALFIGAIARSAAADLAQGVRMSGAEALAFSLTRAKDVVLATVAPVVVVGLIGAGLSVASFALLNWPGLDIVGAVLVGPMLAIALIASATAVIFAFAFPLPVASVVCEGTDSIDALQRTAAYVICKPLRLLWYILVVAFVSTLAMWVAQTIAGGAIGAVRWAAASAGPHAAAIVLGTGGGGVAHSIVEFWFGALGALVAGYGVSLLSCGGAGVYLLVRQAADGQDYQELWFPGLVEGTMARSMEVRLDAGGPLASSSSRLTGERDDDE